jgi:sigma-54 dependent transcriptional regulator, acetoin dehydrogenase operon transcriptional activator AcoR
LTMAPPSRAEADALSLRIGGKCVWVPALRERFADLPALWDSMTESFTPGCRLVLRADTLAVLRAHRWPGNLSEFRSVVRQVVDAQPRGPVAPHDLPKSVRDACSRMSLIERVEREAIRQALDEAEGNRARAAEILGISRATVYRKMKTYRLGG